MNRLLGHTNPNKRDRIRDKHLASGQVNGWWGPVKQASTICVWLSIGSALVVFAVLLYLLVAGQGMGLKVSSLDASGPQWPFTVVWIAGASTLTFAAAAMAIGLTRWATQVAHTKEQNGFPPHGREF